jgi:hypothetical protein
VTLPSPKSVMNRVAAASLAGVIAFAPIASAAEKPASPATPVSITNEVSKVKVPMSDARGIQERGVQLSAAALSKNGQIMIFYGNVSGDPDVHAAFQAMTEAAREVIAAGKIPLKGVIVTDPMEMSKRDGTPFDRTVIQFYANGFPTAVILDPGAKVGAKVKETLQEDYAQVILPSRSVASNDTKLDPRP